MRLTNEELEQVHSQVEPSWMYELVDYETNNVVYKTQLFKKTEAPTSKPYHDIVLDTFVQWHPCLP